MSCYDKLTNDTNSTDERRLCQVGSLEFEVTYELEDNLNLVFSI